MDFRNRIWDLLGPERRQAVAEAFWEDPAQKPAHQQVEALLGQRLKARPVFIRRLPVEKKAAYLSREMLANQQLWEAAMTAYHFAGHRSMLVDFVEGVGIPHENGHYELPDAAEAPSPETLDKAAQALAEKYRPVDVAVYLGVLVLQDQKFWANLRPIVERMMSEVESDQGAASAENREH
jgi:hypothetical protein